MAGPHAGEKSMFRIVTSNGLDVVFNKHNNGNWRAVAYRDGESFELSRSIDPGHLPWFVDNLVEQPEDPDADFKKLCRKLRKSHRKHR